MTDHEPGTCATGTGQYFPRYGDTLPRANPATRHTPPERRSNGPGHRVPSRFPLPRTHSAGAGRTGQELLDAVRAQASIGMFITIAWSFCMVSM